MSPTVRQTVPGMLSKSLVKASVYVAVSPLFVHAVRGGLTWSWTLGALGLSAALFVGAMGFNRYAGE